MEPYAIPAQVYAAGRVEQALAGRIVARPADQRAHRRLRLLGRWPVARGLRLILAGGRRSGADRHLGALLEPLTSVLIVHAASLKVSLR